MAGVNKATLVGRLGQDPETRYTANGKQVTTLSVATSERWTDQSGQRQEHTEWHKVVLWGRVAEIATQYLAKGALVYLEGRIRTRKWQDSNGQDRYSTEINGDSLQMLSSPKDPAKPPAQESRKTAPAAKQAAQDFQAPAAAGSFDDDIPFAPVPYV